MLSTVLSTLNALTQSSQQLGEADSIIIVIVQMGTTCNVRLSELYNTL